MFPQFRRVVGVAQKAGVICHDKGGDDIQKLLEFQIVIIPHPSGWEFPAVNMRKADKIGRAHV